MQCGDHIRFSEAEEVLYSKAYLDSILLNLLSNALKYRAPDRKPLIRFKTEKVARGVVLHVTDNGLGIDLEKYGSELFGLRKTFHQHPDSKGVGLFLTRAQIKSMGGDITARSELNVGTTFIVEF
ncbi:MAG: ATP-binding protein [Bacteroidota bacterium]